MSDCADECRRCPFEPPGARQTPPAVNQTPDPAANRRNSPPLQAAGRTDAGLPAQEQLDVAGSCLDQHALADILVTAHPHATHSVTTACPRARIQTGRSRERPWDGSRKRPLLRACRTWRRPVGSIVVSDIWTAIVGVRGSRFLCGGWEQHRLSGRAFFGLVAGLRCFDRLFLPETDRFLVCCGARSAEYRLSGQRRQARTVLFDFANSAASFAFPDEARFGGYEMRARPGRCFDDGCHLGGLFRECSVAWLHRLQA